MNKKIIGYHYSSKNIKNKDIIHSYQNKGLTYNLVWNIYNKVAKELGINNFPYNYGYAYPYKARGEGSICRGLYEVESDENKVIKGNYNYSVYITMDCGFNVRHIKNLKERLKERDRIIEEKAKKYFTLIEDITKIELISEEWKVKNKIG